MNQDRNDFDSPWKEALEKLLRPFPALCFPANLYQLLQLMDWLLPLLPPQEHSFRQELLKLQPEKIMPFVTSFERFARQESHQAGRTKGRMEGRQEGLHAGQIEALKEAIRECSPPDSTRFHPTWPFGWSPVPIPANCGVGIASP